MDKLLISGLVVTSVAQSLYSENPILASAPYSEQFEVVQQSLAGWISVAWGEAAESAGYFHAVVFFCNVKPLQVAWAKQHGVAFRDEHWAQDIHLAQVQYHKPIAWFVYDIHTVNQLFREHIRRSISSIKVAFGWDGFGKRDPYFFRGTDIIFSCLNSIAQYYTENGIQGYYLPWFFHAGLRSAFPSVVERDIEVSFVGGIALFKGGHFQRTRLLYDIHRSIPNFTMYLSETPNLTQSAKGIVKFILKGEYAMAKEYVALLSKLQYLRKSSLGSAYSQKMFHLLLRSKISINSHGDLASDKAANIRLFETTGMGACLLTEHTDNIREFFEPDTEIVTYQSPAECVEKINFLLNNDKAREQIANAGMQRTLREHTAMRRISYALDIVVQHIAKAR